MMKQSITESMFVEAFKKVRPDNFSRDGLCALFQFLEEEERDSGVEIELDVISLCCDFSEYESATLACEELVKGWEKPEREEGQTDEEYAQAVDEIAADWLRDETQFIPIDGGTRCIVHQF